MVFKRGAMCGVRVVVGRNACSCGGNGVRREADEDGGGRDVRCAVVVRDRGVDGMRRQAAVCA